MKCDQCGRDVYCGEHVCNPAIPSVGSLEYELLIAEATGDIPLGLGPRHDHTGTAYTAARIGQGLSAKFDAMTWTDCNGQRCAGHCGPGHSVRLWVPCRFAVGCGHSYHLDDKEIAGLTAVLASLGEER